MASLPEVLYDLPTERLRKLVQTRRLDTKKLALMPNKRQLTQFLAAEFIKPPSIAEAVTQCNARELRLLQLLISAETGQVMPWEKLLEAAGGPALADALTPILTRLEDLGLAFRVEKGVYLPDLVRSYVPASLSDRYTLERCLEQYDANSLKRICANLGLPQDTKPVNIRAIKTTLLVDGAVQRLKKPLSEQEVAVLEYLVQSGGNATASAVASAALKGQSEDFFRYDWQNRWKQGNERNAVDTLLARGLLYVIAYDYGYNLFLILPSDLLRALTGGGDRDFWTLPPPTLTPLQSPAGRVSQHDGLIRDVVSLLGYVSVQDAVRTNTGHIHKTNLKNLMRALSLPEERYASFLYALCREAGLIAVQGEKQVYKITPAGNSWLHWDSSTQIRALTDAWRKGMLWAEMYNEPLQRSSDYRSQEAVLRMRQAALNVVADTTGQNEVSTSQNEAPSAEKPPDTQTAAPFPFYELVSVTETLAFQYPLLLTQSSAMGPDLVPSPTTFVRLLVAECLYWLGLVELTLPPEAQGVASSSLAPPSSSLAKGVASQKPTLPDAAGYRLTPLGRYLLGVEGGVPPEPRPREEQFIVQANGEIFLAPYLEPATLYHLLAMTEPPAKGGTGNTVSLTRESIRRCLDQGEKTRDVLAFLQTHARTGIPQNVEYLINDVGGKHGHIHIGKAQMYVQVDTPLLLKELEARKELKPYFVRALSDTVAILKADEPDKLLRDLRKAGYLPVSDDDTPQAMLSLRARPAPPPAPLSTAVDNKQAQRAAKADATVDWNRIAQDDGKPWQTGGEASGTVTNVVRNQTLIKTLLMQASKTHIVVEIEYLEPGKPMFLKREIEPERVIGNFVNAFDRLTGEQVSFTISRIQWARLTGEIFSS